MYGEMRYNCPGIYLSTIFDEAGVTNNYNYRWNVEVASDIASGLGVPHTAELPYIWGGSNVSQIQAYWTSFIRTFNPNTFMEEGSTVWERFSKEGMERILFESGNASMEAVPQGPGSQGERCAFNSKIGPSLQQ